MTNHEGRLRAALDDAGLGQALDAALDAAGLDTVPSQPESLVQFLGLHLTEALTGRLHPTSAGDLVQRLASQLLSAEIAAEGDDIEIDMNGILAGAPGATDGNATDDDDDDDDDEEGPTGVRAVGPRGEGEEPSDVRTLPPPSDDGAKRAYDDLVSGVVHDRVTPVWGVQRPEIHEEVVWAVVSLDEGLLAMTEEAAGPSTDVLHVVSMELLRQSLVRPNARVVVVLDAGFPSIPIERVVAVLTEDAASRVLLWRMADDERERLLEAVPSARTWLPCAAEVTPAEIVQLLGT